MRLGLVSIQRNRARWIKEWMCFHYLIGFRSFYIYLHKCTDNSLDVVNSLGSYFNIKTFLVGDDIDRPQDFCYKHAYSNFGHEVDWMGFLDGDEFVFNTIDIPLEIILEEYLYSKISALAVYWRCFGSSFHLKEPSGLVIENYRFCSEHNNFINKHVKSLVIGHQGDQINPGPDPHVFSTPYPTVDENYNVVKSGISDFFPTYNKICINHYVTQSREFFDFFKATAGTPMDFRDQKRVKDEGWWVTYDRNELLDDKIIKFLPDLKSMLDSIN